MSTTKINREQAEKEIGSWLDFKKIGTKKKETYQDQIDVLVDAVAEGELILDENKNLVQTLKFPVGEEVKITELKYKPRITVLEVHSKLENMKSSGNDARVLAYVAAITGQNNQIIRHMDTDDYGIAQCIAIFFL